VKRFTGFSTLEISRFRAACGATPLEMTRRVFSSSPERVMPSEAEASQTGFGLPHVNCFATSPPLRFPGSVPPAAHFTRNDKAGVFFSP